MNRNKKLSRKSNQGNSFVIVIATLSFLAVLTTALLVAVGVCYRMKAFDINSRDNFYYLEKAMDEVYEGIGTITMKHLNEAYNSVTDVIVVYDTEKKAYVTMDNEDANKLLNTLFMEKIKGDSRLSNNIEGVDGQSNIYKTIDGLITKQLSDGSSNGITLASVGNVIYSTKGDSATIKQIVLKRTAEYSTVNSYKDSSKMAEPAEYVQSITTDLVIAAPNFVVDFSSVDSDPIYDFVMIGDMGVEIEGVNTRSVIDGNIYAANDFYNKRYNDSEKTNVSAYKGYKDAEEYKGKITDRSDIPDSYNGIKEKSMYSGLYINKSKVSIVADRIIVPGSIAAMNSAELSIVGSGKPETTVEPAKEPDSTTNHKLAQVWTDNIILGGYSKKLRTNDTSESKVKYSTKDFKGADIELSADTFVSDDLELNATGSKYVLDGNYYGYSNATTDKRWYGKAYLSEVLNEPIDSMNDVEIRDGNYYKGETVLNLPGQSHYNSSAIVVNGQCSELDLSKSDSIYIAGQAYVEMSKEGKKRANAMRESKGSGDSNNDDIYVYDSSKETVDKDEQGNDDISKIDYSKEKDESDADYKNSVYNDEGWKYDDEGNLIPNSANPSYSFKDKSDDNYSDYHESSIRFEGNGKVQYDNEYSDGDPDKNKRIEDYRTGESISVKSNQLAYIPPYNVEVDPETNRCYVKWPQILKDDPYFKTLFDDLEKVPVVKTVVSGKTYYFYDFTGTKVDLSEYMNNYAALFYVDKHDSSIEEGTRTKGDMADMYDITDWEQFKVGSILIDDAKLNGGKYEYSKKIYSNGAISVKTDADETLRVIGNHKEVNDKGEEELVKVNQKLLPFINVNDTLKLKLDETPQFPSNDKSKNATELQALKVSSALQKHYKELRLLLTDKPTVSDAKNLVDSSDETSITPINTYFDYSNLNQSFDKSFQKVDNEGKLQDANVATDVKIDYEAKGSIILQSNYQIFESEKDVVVKDYDNDGKVMGVVICKGDVTFDSNVREFHGLIVSGGKIKVVDQNINFVANREIVKAVLEECSTSSESKLQNFALLFRSYSDKIAASGSSSPEVISSMKSVSSVEYEDVLGFNNWRKNVD